MIISVSQQKGGVGKTATSVMLSQFYSFIKMYRVLLIDLDPQGNATSSFIDKDGLSLKSVFMDKKPLDSVLKKTYIENLDIICSDIEMEELESYLIVNPSGSYFVKDLIGDRGLRQKYDIIMIDTPPHLGRLTINSLVASDFVLTPLESKIFAADGLGSLLSTIDQVRNNARLNPGLKMLGAFLNKFEERTTISRDIIQSFKEQIPDILLHTNVRFNIRIEECLGKRHLIYTYDPKCNGAVDFTSLGEEVLSRAATLGIFLPEVAGI